MEDAGDTDIWIQIYFDVEFIPFLSLYFYISLVEEYGR